MRQVLEGASLPDTAQVLRADPVGDGMGGDTQTFDNTTEIYAALACDIALPTGGTPAISMLGQVLAERVGNRTIMVATFPAGSDVQAGDRIIASGRTYEALKHINAGPWEIGRRVMGVAIE